MCSPAASMRSAYGNADVLSLSCDLPDDLDDVAVRVVDTELRVGARPAAKDVPPDVRVVRDASRALELADDLGVVGVVTETRRRAGAREGGEDHVPRRGKPCRLPAPERRARGERDELGEMGDETVHDLDCLLRVVHSD